MGQDTSLGGNPKVVGTKSWCDMDDTGAVFGRHEIADDHAESITFWLHVGHQLFVMDARQVSTGTASDNFNVDLLATNFAGASAIDQCALQPQHLAHQWFGKDHRDRSIGVGIAGIDLHIIDGLANRQGSIARKRPRRRRPGEEKQVACCILEQGLRFCIAHDFELCDNGRVFDGLVGSGLIQLVGAQTRTRSRRIRLDCISFIKGSLCQTIDAATSSFQCSCSRT